MDNIHIFRRQQCTVLFEESSRKNIILNIKSYTSVYLYKGVTLGKGRVRGGVMESDQWVGQMATRS